MDYNNLKGLAYNQLKDKGTAFTIVRKNNATFNSKTGSYGTSTETNYACYGIRLDFKKQDKPRGNIESNSYYGMEGVETDSVLFLIASKDLTITPERTDRIIFNSIQYEIIDVEILSPNGTDILYKVRANK